MAGPEHSSPGAALQPDVETRPKALATWLDRLPYASPADAARQLVTALYGLNRHALDEDARYALLVLYRPALARAAAGLEGLLGEGGVPPQPQQRQLGALLRGLHSEHALGCKQVLDSRPRRFGRANPKRIAGAVAQQMAALRDLQAACYLTYTGLPSGLWQDLHRLHAFAQASKLADVDADAAPAADLIYRQALLLALADPPHMTHAELMQTRLHLDQLAGLAQLGAPAAGGGRGFWIRTDGDAPPNAFAAAATEGALWLDTDALCRTLHETVSRRDDGRTSRAPGLAGAVEGDVSLKLFKRLLQQWSGRAQRSFKRYAARGGSVQLVAGISTIHRLLDGVGQAPRLDADDSAVAVADVTGPAAAAPIVVNATHWTVINDSASGLALLGAPNAPLNLKAGDALALRAADAREWSLAVVRWVRMRDSDEAEIELGIERLAPQVRPLWLRALNGKRSRTEPALLLPGLPALKQPDRLLLPRRVYHAGMEADVWEDARRYSLTFGRMLEQTPSFDLVDFTVFEEPQP